MSAKLGLTVNQKAKLKITRQFVVAGLFLGIAYIFIEWGIAELYHYILGAAVGSILGLLIATLELFLFSRGAKKLKFIWLLILRGLLFFTLITVVIFNGTVITQMIRNDTGYLETISAEYIQDYLSNNRFLRAVVYTLVFAFAVNFVRMISRKMGQGMLVSYILGTYYTPVHQTRIIMFLKVAESKEILRKLGSAKLHKFLNELYYDLSVPVVRNSGIIYEYIEELMVISWAMDKGLKNASCIRVFFDIQNTLKSKKEKYLVKYGFVPHVQAALHTGSVVRAEIGEVKTQIAFHGDTMNTTSRILYKCRELKLNILASDQLVRMIGLPRIYNKVSVGEIDLRGKQEDIKLFEIVVNEGEK